MERFYRFVKAVLRYSRNRPGDSEIRKLIIAKGGEVLKDQECLNREAERFSSLYFDILEFHDTPFPDAIVEQKSPIACYHALEFAFGRDRTEDIDQGMQSIWGSDWRRILDEQRARL